MELTDQEYVKRSRDGYPEDFRMLVQRYQRALFAYLQLKNHKKKRENIVHFSNRPGRDLGWHLEGDRDVEKRAK